MNNFIIEIDNLSYYSVFKEFNIQIAKNKFITISGPNNCGKTTLIRILDGTIATKNTIKINEKKIEDYQITDLCKIIQTIIPKEIEFYFQTIEQELYYTLENTSFTKEEKEKRFHKLLKIFKWNSDQDKKIEELNEYQKIKLQLALALIIKPKILLLDNICSGMNKKQTTEIINILKTYQEEEITIIMTTSNLLETINSDYLYIITDSKIILQGKPLEVLEKDNILNKIGLNLPFMIDLSIKLKDYGLVDKIELDMDRMVDKLWK